MEIKKYHLVYKITNVKNGKYYIGVHSTYNIHDGYMGSGTLLRREIKEFGLDCFDREILHSCSSREDALSIEKELVDFDLLHDINCYNLILGGNNGIVTTKTKRQLFYRNPNPIQLSKEVAFERFDDNCRYVMRIEKPIIYLGKAPLMELWCSPWILELITDLYNNKFTNSLALKYIDLLPRIKAYRNNFYIEETAW